MWPQRFPFFTGLKGNAVKIGDSSRCCKPRLFCVGRMPCKKVRAFGTLSHCAFTKNAWEGLKSGVSQKTCHCMTEILQPAENGRSLESIYGMFFHIFNAVPYGFPDTAGTRTGFYQLPVMFSLRILCLGDIVACLCLCIGKIQTIYKHS